MVMLRPISARAAAALTVRRVLPVLPVLLVLLSGCGPSEEKQLEVKAAAISAESAKAVAVAARPSTGLWDLDHVSERLVRSGVAPRRITPTPESPDFFAGAKETGAFSVGRGGELRVFVFRDSTARRKVTEALDRQTATPKGQTRWWPKDAVLIVVQNLAGVMMGGTDRLKERVQLGLEAGIAGPSK